MPDGGASNTEQGISKKNELYFFGGVSGKNDSADITKEANRRLKDDAKFFDDITKFQMMAISKLFRLPIPEVYNCCPHSSYESFPKISCEDAIKILQEEKEIA